MFLKNWDEKDLNKIAQVQLKSIEAHDSLWHFTCAADVLLKIITRSVFPFACLDHIEFYPQRSNLLKLNILAPFLLDILFPFHSTLNSELHKESSNNWAFCPQNFSQKALLAPIFFSKLTSTKVEIPWERLKWWVNWCLVRPSKRV